MWVTMVTNPVPAAYARFESDPVVRRLAPTSLMALGSNPVDPLAYRDRTMLAVPPDEIQRIALDVPGVLTQADPGRQRALARYGINQRRRV